MGSISIKCLIWVLASLLFLISCQGKNNGVPNTNNTPQSNPNTSSPAALLLSGKNQLYTGECAAYEISLLDVANQPIKSPETLKITISGIDNLYQDSNCQTLMSELQIKKGDLKQNFFLKFNTPKTVELLFSSGLFISNKFSITIIEAAYLTLLESNPYGFGTRYIGSHNTILLTLKNEGVKTATDLSTTAFNTPFDYTGGVFPGTSGTCTSQLGAGQSCLVEVEFDVESVGNFQSQSNISYSNGNQTKTLTLTLTGTGVTSGSSDTNFGSSGSLTHSLGLFDDRAFKSITDPNNRILTVGASNDSTQADNFAIVRYESSGNIDTSFANQGIQKIDFNQSTDRATTVAIQSDRKILLAGESFNGTTYNFGIARIHSDGSIDTSFGTNGKVSIDFGNGHDYARSIALDSSGKILVSGEANIGSNTYFAITRLLSNGQLDTSFGGSGILTFSAGSSKAYGYKLAIQTDGKILISGYAMGENHDFSVMRINSNGTLDTSFGTNGITLIDFETSSDRAKTLLIQNDGKIVVGGTARTSKNVFGILRLTTSGVLDTSFIGTGKLTKSLGTTSDEFEELCIDGSGKIIAVGTANSGGNEDFGAIRIASNGTIDTTFGINGVLIRAIGSSSDRARSCHIQADGKMLVTGDTFNGSFYKFAMIRIWP